MARGWVPAWMPGTFANRVQAAARSQSWINLVAVAIRTVAKLGWGLAVPACLTVSGFGVYVVLQATVGMVAQFSLMGAPQVVLRSAGRRIPLGGILLHSLGLAVPLTVLGLVVSGAKAGWPQALAAFGGCALIVQFLFSARLKSTRNFGGVLIAESAGAVVLLVCASVLVASHAGLVPGFPTVSFVHVFAIDLLVMLLITAVVLWHQRTTLRDDLHLAGACGVLPSLYSVGALVMMESLFWRLQLYALNASPDGLEGVAVFGLAMQLIQPAFLSSTAIVEPWWTVIAAASRRAGPDLPGLVDAKDRLYRRLFLGLILLLLAALPFVLRLAFARFLPWSSYVYAFVALKLLSGMSGFWSSALYATGNEKLLYVPTVAAAGIALAGSLTLTLHAGLGGAVVVFGATQLTLFVLVRRAYNVYRSGMTLRPYAQHLI
jgi:O-antigen/teichoic acid export membrane protein